MEIWVKFLFVCVIFMKYVGFLQVIKSNMNTVQTIVDIAKQMNINFD